MLPDKRQRLQQLVGLNGAADEGLLKATAKFRDDPELVRDVTRHSAYDATIARIAGMGQTCVGHNGWPSRKVSLTHNGRSNVWRRRARNSHLCVGNTSRRRRTTINGLGMPSAT